MVARPHLTTPEPEKPARDVAGRFVARLAAAVVQAVFLLLLARSLGPSQFGELAVAMAVGVIVGTVLGLGAETRVLRVRAEQCPDRVAGALARVRVAGTALALLVSLVSCELP